MKKITTYLFLSLLIVSSPLLGHFIGEVVGKSIDERKWSDQVNAPWQQIDSPYRFVEILDVAPNSLWAKTAENKHYYLEFQCQYGGSECVKWIETKEALPDTHNYGTESAELPLQSGKTCPTTREPFPPDPPQTVAECVLDTSNPYSNRYYALVDDGTIWYWDTPIGNDFIGSDDVLALVGLVIGVAVSALLVIVFIFMMIRETNQKNYLQGIIMRNHHNTAIIGAGHNDERIARK